MNDIGTLNGNVQDAITTIQKFEAKIECVNCIT